MAARSRCPADRPRNVAARRRRPQALTRSVALPRAGMPSGSLAFTLRRFRFSRRDGAVMLARWPRGALGALAWAMVAWAAPVAAYLLGQQLLADATAPQRLATLAVALLAVALVGCLAAG